MVNKAIYRKHATCHKANEYSKFKIFNKDGRHIVIVADVLFKPLSITIEAWIG